MFDRFMGWYFKPAAWWQFWLPQSGAIGGGLLGVAAICLALLITYA